MEPRILIVDDEVKMAEVIAMALTRAGYSCVTCNDAVSALARFEADGADAVITDWKMPDIDGIELMRRLHVLRPQLPVIVLTAHGSVPSAVAAMRDGAFDYVTKPFDNNELKAVLARALRMRTLERENLYLRQEVASRYTPDAIVAVSPRSREVLDLVRRVAPSRASVLIQGESGTGKELIARLLHYWSDRVGEPFVAINCKAFAEGVLESELFGHEKGAFTGASTSRAGCFERAHGGTLFLDEIGEVSVEFQAKLLRVLQEGEVLPVGGNRSRKVTVRVVAATNRKLQEEMAAGRFREDLFFRLNVIPMQLPALRERREDILPLAQHFLARFAAEASRPLSFSREVETALVSHEWRGNVRELENAIERAVVLCRGAEIQPEDLLLTAMPAVAVPVSGGDLQSALDQTTAARIRGALQACNGQRAEAAKMLGIERTTLYRLMRKLGLQ